MALDRGTLAKIDRLVMTDVDALGLLGFFCQKHGSSKTGNASLTACKIYRREQCE